MQGLAEHNRESAELWLACYGGPYKIYHDQTPESQRFRPGSRLPVSLRWLELSEDPEVAASNRWMREVVLTELPTEQPWFYAVIEKVYLSYNPDYAAPERWRTSTERPDHLLYNLYELAMTWIVQRLGTRVLVVPDPEEARSFVEISRKRQRICKSVYFTVLRETGSKSKARKTAARASGYSVQHVGRIIAPKRIRQAG